MNREHKFRAWDKINKRMTKVSCITFDTRTIVVEPINYVSSVYLALGEYELIQYTGLKDKNGKEIYEGDIIIGNCGEKIVVEYLIYERNCIEDECCGAGFNFQTMKIKDIEVIGNIYENKELIK